MDDKELARIQYQLTKELEKKLSLSEEIEAFAKDMANKILGNSYGTAIGEFYDQKYYFTASSSIREDTGKIVVQVRMRYEDDDASLVNRLKQVRASAEFDSHKSMLQYTSELISVLLYQRYGLPLEAEEEE